MLIRKLIVLLTAISFTCGIALAQEGSHAHKHEGSHKPNVDKPQPNRNDLTLKQRDASHQASESS